MGDGCASTADHNVTSVGAKCYKNTLRGRCKQIFQTKVLSGIFEQDEAEVAILESKEVWKVYSPAQWGIVFTACRMRQLRHLVLVSTNFHLN